MYDMRKSHCENAKIETQKRTLRPSQLSSGNASEIIIYAFTFAKLYTVSAEQCDVQMQMQN